MGVGVEIMVLIEGLQNKMLMNLSLLFIIIMITINIIIMIISIVTIIIIISSSSNMMFDVGPACNPHHGCSRAA